MRRTKKRNAPQGKIERKEKDAKGLVPVRIKRHRDKNGGHNHIIVEDIDNDTILKVKASSLLPYPYKRDSED